MDHIRPVGVVSIEREGFDEAFRWQCDFPPPVLPEWLAPSVTLSYGQAKDDIGNSLGEMGFFDKNKLGAP